MDMRYSGDARVQCAGCNTSTDTHDSHIESHAAWNRRAQPAEAEGVDFGFDDRSVKVSQEAYSIFLARERHHLVALSAVTAERDRLQEENDRLRAGVRGDFDLDAWLDWSRESDQLRTDLRALRYLVGQCVDYLNIGRQSSITNGSILHRTMAVAVEGK